MFSVVIPAYSLDFVTLQTSYMQRPALCPGEPRPTFTCLTLGQNVHWTSNGTLLAFRSKDEVGKTRNIDGFTAVLLGKGNFEYEGRNYSLRTSMLTLPETLSASRLTVQCDNNENIAKNISYRNVAGEDCVQLPGCRVNS